jgi:hypothetical protein
LVSKYISDNTNPSFSELLFGGAGLYGLFPLRIVKMMLHSFRETASTAANLLRALSHIQHRITSFSHTAALAENTVNTLYGENSEKSFDIIVPRIM